MAKGKFVTQLEFNQIKSLTDLKVPHKKVGNAMGRAPQTVSMIAQSKDFEEYKELRTKRAGNSKPKASIRETAEVMGQDTHNSIVATLKAIEYNQQLQNKLLQQILEKPIFT